jgi:hypothetical protein
MVAILSHGLKVYRDGLPNEPKRFRFRMASCNTPVQIGHVCRPAGTGLLEHDCVFLSVHNNFACLNIERTVPGIAFAK